VGFDPNSEDSFRQALAATLGIDKPLTDHHRPDESRRRA
jgi:hypothetical protein